MLVWPREQKSYATNSAPGSPHNPPVEVTCWRLVKHNSTQPEEPRSFSEITIVLYGSLEIRILWLLWWWRLKFEKTESVTIFVGCIRDHQLPWFQWGNGDGFIDLHELKLWEGGYFFLEDSIDKVRSENTRKWMVEVRLLRRRTMVWNFESINYPLKTTISPENWWLEGEISLLNMVPFKGTC